MTGLASSADFLRTRMDLDRYYYLSGPMSGYPELNFPAFKRATAELEESGVKVVSPHTLKPPQTDPTDQDYLANDFAVMSRECRGIILLRGWPSSVGARAELEIALTLKWPVYYYDDYTIISMNAQEVQ